MGLSNHKGTKTPRPDRDRRGGQIHTSYEESRERFRHSLDLLRSQWPGARLESHPLKNHPDLTIDWIWAKPQKKENLVILSTGEHGIEGYVGAAMMKVFIEEFAPRLDPKNTGLLLVHALNPWGMKYRRKVNENSVDLNRNFVFDGNFDPATNPEFHQIAYLINPQNRMRSFRIETLLFWGRVIRALSTAGARVISRAALLGQHHTPNGIYCGGTSYQEGTNVVIQLYRQALEGYQNIIQFDMHTGYGPRYQMTVIVPPNDPVPSAAARQKFNYPQVGKIDGEEFYAISGDMGEYIYRLKEAEYPDRQLFACGFEFGTYGDSLLARIRSLRAMVFENQLHWHGATSEKTAEKVRAEFEALYFPAEGKWREKALADGRQAFRGILDAYQLLK
jgi:hypothetical protein